MLSFGFNPMVGRSGDGYGDNERYPDIFPSDPTQWVDSDGDGYETMPLGILVITFLMMLRSGMILMVMDTAIIQTETIQMHSLLTRLNGMMVMQMV